MQKVVSPHRDKSYRSSVEPTQGSHLAGNGHFISRIATSRSSVTFRPARPSESVRYLTYSALKDVHDPTRCCPRSRRFIYPDANTPLPFPNPYSYLSSFVFFFPCVRGRDGHSVGGAGIPVEADGQVGKRGSGAPAKEEPVVSARSGRWSLWRREDVRGLETSERVGEVGCGYIIL